VSTPELTPDLARVVVRLAARIGCTSDALFAAAMRNPFWYTPGTVVRGEKPLPLGTIINLMREVIGSDCSPRDQGWVVSGYTRKRDGRWTGYTLARGALKVESSSVSNCERIVVVDPYEEPGT
jgi:hypothetical protein